MTRLVTIGADCEAAGHPTECTNPAPGTVDKVSTASITVTNSGGTTDEIASADTADMHFDSHGHATDASNNCTDFQTHDLDPDAAALSQSLTLNGSPVYVVGSDVATDPGSGDSINIINAGTNNSMEEL